MTKLQELEELLPQKKSKEFYAKKLNITELEVEELRKELKNRRMTEEVEVEDSEETIEENIAKGTLKATRYHDTSPSSPEEVMQIHSIDTRKWRLSQYWSKKKGDKWLVSALFSAIKPDEDIVEQKNIILEEIKDYLQTVHKPQIIIPRKQGNKANTLLEIAIPDLHIGKLAHEDEVGENYDIRIATNRAKEAVSELVSRVNLERVERILFPVGNDLINVDNEQQTTTAGTPQDCDSRFSKMVKTTRALLIEIIDELAKIAPVDVPIVIGNHDQTVSFFMGEILDAFYHSHQTVNIDNTPTWRKYYQYYDNGFQFSHGNNESHQDLGLIFATEQPKLWADTTHRYCQLGHYHKTKKIQYVAVDTKPGFQIEVLPSLSGTDWWHSSKGYMSNKQAKAFQFHQEQGEIACYTYTV